VAAEGWQRAKAQPDWLDPPPPTWTPAATTAAYDSDVHLRTLADDDPLPALTPGSPRLERVLAWLVPAWAARRAAARRARYQQAVAARIAAAQTARRREPDLPSPAGPRWRGSAYWRR
jgi:hypothetical protein